MQSMHIPKGVCQEIEKLQISFIWGHIKSSKKIRLVNWNTLCLPKDRGGLGIRRLFEVNSVMLMKISWKVCTNDDNMCSTMLKGKYGRGVDLMRHCVAQYGDSLLWRELGHLWSHMLRQGRWTVGNSMEINFDGPLVE